MLVVTSILLLAAVGFLAVALVTGQMWLAWVSIAASATAALALFVRWWRLRRSSARRRPAVEAAAPDRADSSKRARRSAMSPLVTSQPDTPQPDTPQPGSAAAAQQQGEPAEEDTDAADLLLVCELDDEVLVVDERPRYHLLGCRWVGMRPTEVLPVRQARELGFTPCAGCGPDAELAVRHRATSTG